jgi:hypothetical protein
VAKERLTVLRHGHTKGMSFLVRKSARRLGPVGVAFLAYDVWKRLPKKQQEQLIKHGRKAGSEALTLLKRESARLQARRA